MACDVQSSILNEIGNAKFCLLVNESRDASRREHMTLVLWFVDKEGFIRDHFFLSCPSP
jgi:hypothetical protein